ncbi:hypothetical protein DFH07DRAFT_687037, partial [Mycena maculata]
GPVLAPFYIRATGVSLYLNPLLQPSGDPYLEWDMLFPSNKCWRSDEPPNLSWSNGRREPATFPRVTHIRLISEMFPWELNISARNPNIGVTCGEIIEGIDREMHNFVGEAEYDAFPDDQKDVINDAYSRNRSREDGVPDGLSAPGIRWLDWLRDRTMFGGLRENKPLVARVCGDVLPCTFEL